MITQANLDEVFETMAKGAEHEVSPYDPSFVAFVRLQTQLMLEMQNTLAEQSELQRNQLIVLNGIWEKLHTQAR